MNEILQNKIVLTDLNLSKKFWEWVLFLTDEYRWNDIGKGYIKHISTYTSISKFYSVDEVFSSPNKQILHDIIYQVLQGIKKATKISLSDFKRSIMAIKSCGVESITHKTFNNEDYISQEIVYFAAFQWLFNDSISSSDYSDMEKKEIE